MMPPSRNVSSLRCSTTAWAADAAGVLGPATAARAFRRSEFPSRGDSREAKAGGDDR
jgi:hypothetical protein